MANLHLVTGYAGEAHVTAADDGSFNTAIFGTGQYVLDIGNKFAASVVSNNKITIADGDLLMQGRHVRLAEGTTVDLTITNGTQGKKRNDLIVARYTKDAVSGVEQVNLVVIQGTAVDSDPVDPAYTSGDIINDHDLLNDMPLYRVPLDGLNVGTPVALFSVPSGVTMTKLWENESPSSSFIAQSVPLGLSGYDFVAIEFCYSNSSNTAKQTAILRVGAEGYLSFFGGLEYAAAIYFTQRYVTIGESGVVFAAGYLKLANSTSKPGSDNTSCIPVAIYGIRGTK